MKQKHTVLCGIDREDAVRQALEGKKVALLTAASGVNKQGRPTYSVLADMAELKILLAPEHGLYSAMQDGLFGSDDGAIHPATGAKMYSLTSKGHPRLTELMSEVDVAVYDIQDVGARFYTYLCNLTQMMRAAKEAGKPVLVLDRPNPIGGIITEGLLLDESKHSSFIGEFAIPTRYGLTVGEYARYVNDEKGIGCDLEVIPCIGWKRDMYFDETDLIWVNPSPNIPTVDSAINYIAHCVWEATNISEGRGTTRPFDDVGAPFVDPEDLCRYMNGIGMEGVIFRPTYFTPMFNKHAGQVCGGVESHITDRDAYRPYRAMLHMFAYMKKHAEMTTKPEGLALRVGQDFLTGDYDPEEVWQRSCEEAQKFSKNVEKYRIYTE